MVMQCVLSEENFVLLCQRFWQKLGYCLAQVPWGCLKQDAFKFKLTLFLL